WRTIYHIRTKGVANHRHIWSTARKRGARGGPVSNSVKDRSGVGLPPKAERRALGKAAAAKRAAQRRRKQLLTKIGKIAAPIGLVLVVIGAVWLFTGSDSPPASPQAENPS